VGASDAAILATNNLNEMVLVARQWITTVEVSPGVNQLITLLYNITGPGTQDGSSTSFNDKGELLFRVTLGGNGAILIADTNATCRPVITDQPDNASVSAGDSATFSVDSTSRDPAPTTYQWYHNGVALSDGAEVDGATEDTLTVSNLASSDAGSYTVAVSNVCGATLSAAATLIVNVCIADVDDGTGTGTPDGGVGIEDLLYYLGLYDAGSAAADVDDGSGTGAHDGGVGIEDLLYYVLRFDAGC
jgi:hypothetical protein